MKVISVNVARPREVEWRGQKVNSSIFKAPVNGRIRANRLNLEGDRQADLMAHGGEHRAVMVYQIESYQYWREILDHKSLEFGQFGENLTVEGLADDEVYIGDRFEIGSAIFEITQPRVTCFKVGISTGISDMPALLVKHKRPGFYFRVIKEGEIGAGDIIKKISDGHGKMSVAEIDGLLYLNEHTKDKLERALRLPALSQGWKGSFQELLDAHLAGITTGNAGLHTPARRLAWTGFRPFILRRTKMESTTVRSFELVTTDNTPVPAFMPGQHIAVRIPSKDNKIPLVRMYSLCGPPQAGYLRIAVKREINGNGSQLMHDLQEGEVLEISAPRGDFILSEGNSPVILLSAGVGVTPLLSMLHTLANQQSRRDIWWIHSNKNSSHEAFKDEIISLSKTFSSIRRVTIYSAPGEDEHIAVDYDLQGHVNTEMLCNLDLPLDGEYYICGPESYMQTMLDHLKSLDIPAAQVKYEVFESYRNLVNLPAKTSAVDEGSNGSGYLVTFSKSRIAFRWHNRFSNLLEAAEACDIPVSWSCRSGVCRRCETGIIDGEVVYAIDPLDSPAEGNVLICCALPNGDLNLDL